MQRWRTVDGGAVLYRVRSREHITSPRLNTYPMQALTTTSFCSPDSSLLLSLDVHPKIVQELLGHSNISVTMDIYSHSIPSLQEEAMLRLDALLGTVN